MSFGMNMSRDNSVTFADLEQWLIAEEDRMKPAPGSAAIREEALAGYRARDPIIKRERGPPRRTASNAHAGRNRTFPSTQDKRAAQCGHCGNRGHTEQQCWYKQTELDLRALFVNQLREVQRKIKEVNREQHSHIATSSPTAVDNVQQHIIR